MLTAVYVCGVRVCTVRVYGACVLSILCWFAHDAIYLFRR